MRVSLWLASLVSCTWAHPAAFHPSGRDDISFAITVSSASSSSEPESLLFQLKAPTTTEWVALAQGDQMAGANMFLVYASSTLNNVTVSPRTAVGHVPPSYKPNSRIKLLAGTGIKDGIMTANIRCDNCLKGQGGSMDPASSATHWIWAYKDGSPMNTDDIAIRIGYHDSFGRVLVDLSHTRTDASSQDPFLDGDFSAVRPADGLSDAGSLSKMAIAHGCLMAIAFVLLFPLFAILVPLGAFIPMSVMKVHAPLQGVALAAVIAGLGLGVKMWTAGDAPIDAHPIIGIVAVAVLSLCQPALGWLQHRHFVRTRSKSWYAYGHRWLGRSAILLGVINGGLGLLGAGASYPGPLRNGMIVYTAVAAVVFVAYMAVRIVITIRTAGDRKVVDGGPYENMDSGDES
ncbi:hypothetical protein EYZ11_007599 [Aspergillus tanneri]|uniref:DOMON domain-containing protein n=1 Tax=Aspergillus tanneri TaxID=1220188 RepID=A0A4S3JCL4_9EURO|nr:uncharacterized protein ATNIH1004_001769 [Aspergillus tanneri]KAA8652860.1 hypothetical protein ATNIH1004_001769 [Aspergillus tanneri]THC92929.1 hypothetical protein EYZ11_007599 [Aspergillus tanneri]